MVFMVKESNLFETLFVVPPPQPVKLVSISNSDWFLSVGSDMSDHIRYWKKVRKLCPNWEQLALALSGETSGVYCPEFKDVLSLMRFLLSLKHNRVVSQKEAKVVLFALKFC